MRIKLVNPNIARSKTATTVAAREVAKGPAIGIADLLAGGSR